MSLRVVLAEDSLITREGLQQLLAASPAIEVVAHAQDLDSLREAVERERPDVVLTDIRMPPTFTGEGIRVATELRAEHPEVGVLVLSQHAEPEYVMALLDAGSDRRGYLLKENVHRRGVLGSALDSIAKGGSVIDPKIV